LCQENIGAFVLGCVMAGLAGIIAGPLTTIDPLMGGEMLISSFVVIVIGGLGSLRGAVIAALLIDAVQTLAEFFNTDADHPHWVCHRSWSRPLRMWF